MRAPLILLLGLAPLARAGDCNKNKHCDSDEFCYSSSDAACSNRNCDCKACSSYGGKPGFSANGQNCDRYENVCGGDCTASAPAPAPAPNPPTDCDSPETESECRAAVAAAGLSEGGCNYAFSGNYGSGRGCYTYETGSCAGAGFWSTSGNPTGDPGGSRVRVCAVDGPAPAPAPDPAPAPAPAPPTDNGNNDNDNDTDEDKDEAAAAAASGGACDLIDVAGTDSDMGSGSYDGLYEEAGACNGQPYYKCTCCTAYDPARDTDDPDECLSEKDFHHYVWYDGAAWQLRLYTGGAGDPWGWDECGGGSGWGDEYRLADPDGDLAAASVEGTWEKQETDYAGGDMVYVWNDHAMTATCKADSSASAASGFNAILAGERGTPLQALLLMALIVAALLGVCCCYFSAKAVSGMLQASNAGPKKKRAAMALPRKVATVPGYELLGSPGPALAGHERTFFVRLPADAREYQEVKCSTPTGAPVVFQAPAGASPGQTVYVPWDPPGEATVKSVAKPRRYRSELAPPPPPPPAITESAPPAALGCGLMDLDCGLDTTDAPADLEDGPIPYN